MTSYIKMIDMWLIFNLSLPFVEVLLHTYLVCFLILILFSLRFFSFMKDLLREDEREINRHGSVRKFDKDGNEIVEDVSDKIVDLIISEK